MGSHPESKSTNSSTPSTTATSSPPTYPHWHDIIAGAAAGLGARAITAPLDLLKIRRQLAPPSSSSTSTKKVQPITASNNAKTTSFVGGELRIIDDIIAIATKEGGIRSLFRGNVAASYLWMGYSVSQFWIYGQTSEYLQKQCDAIQSNNNLEYNMSTSGAISFTSGAIAGVCATIITYPFDLCHNICRKGYIPNSSLKCDVVKAHYRVGDIASSTICSSTSTTNDAGLCT